MDFNSRRVFKRAVIALIYFLLVGGIVLAGYVLKEASPPSCFDGIQNQSEEGVDCGGPCKTCEATKPVEVFEKKFFVTRPGMVDLFAEVRNPNLAFGLPKFRYAFELYDRDGVFLGARSGVTYILPQSTKFIVEYGLALPKAPDRVEFHFESPQFEEVREYLAPRLSVIGLTTQFVGGDEGGFLAARGNVINQTTTSFDAVSIVVRLKNQLDHTVAATSHEVRTLRQGENRFFESRWNYRVPDFTRAEFQVDTNIFEESNILNF